MSTDTLIFDSTNWNVPQSVFLDYLANGCEQLAIKASGGGYDWQIGSNDIRLQACHLNPVSNSCKEDRVCEN
jgi:hypothetical protein